MFSEPLRSIISIPASAELLDFFKWPLSDTLPYVIFSLIVCSILFYIAYRIALQPLVGIISGILNFFRLQKTKAVFLEITPPAKSEKSSLATQQLFTILHDFVATRSVRWAGLFGVDDVVSLELVSTRQDGIKYLVRVREPDAQPLQAHFASYLPELRFKIIEDDYMPDQNAATIYEVKQARHYGYPLQKQEDLSQHDPIAYIAGAMTKLEPQETMAMQVILAPHKSWWTGRLYSRILHKGYAILDGKIQYLIISRWPIWVVSGLIALSSITWALVVAGILLVISLFRKQEINLTSAEQRLYDGVLDKLSKPLFRVDLRIMIATNSAERHNKLAKGIRTSLAPLNTPGFQQLYSPTLHPYELTQKFSQFKMTHRLPSLFTFDSNILATSEIADIYHFPYGISRTEGLVKSHSRTLPAPSSLKNGTELDVLLGENHHHGTITPIGLTAAERERHVFIIGGTGNGKTTMLQYAIVQDIQNGKGVAVVDPHGDMAETLLQHIPKERSNDLIYFNPDDLAHPIGLNLLELPEGLSGDELLREKDLVTESVVSIFRKIFSDDDTGGHRIEYVLRNTIQTALTTENPTLFTMFDLLNDPAYRKKVVSTLEDKNLKNFWKNELGKAGNFQQVKMAAGITAKIGRFLFSASAKRILEQPKSTIDFDEILDDKILICNFSKGLLGEDTSELFGIAILAKIQLASLRRARKPQEERRPFYVYVDEFQNFATPSFVQMLSEARKYKLFLTMAEQSTSQQQDQQTVQTILANVGTVVCFRTGNPADERLLLPFFEPYVERGEIANLAAYNFYMRISAVKPHEPFSGMTTPIKESPDKRLSKI